MGKPSCCLNNNKIYCKWVWLASKAGKPYNYIFGCNSNSNGVIIESCPRIPDIQHILVKISKYPEFLQHTPGVIMYWNNKVATKRNTREYKQTLYIVRLLHAYLKKDMDELEDVMAPSGAFDLVIEGLTEHDYKNFYVGLLLIQDDPERSCAIFNAIYLGKPQFVSFGINRTIARLNWIWKRKDNTKGEILLAVNEWKIVKNTIQEALVEQLEPEYSNIELRFLFLLNDFEGADKLFKQLPAHKKYMRDLLEIYIENLLARDMTNEAASIVYQAEEYHAYPGVTQPAFISILKDKLSGIDNIQELQGYYLRIISVEPAKLIRIFPSNLNGKRQLIPFLVKDVALAADRMLEKIKSIEQISLEDKYNDLMEVLLNARMMIWNWKVCGQSRGAFSESGSVGLQPGERDLPIMDNNGRVLLMCEAFIYRDKARTQSHLQKVFNYHHQKNAFVILVYDTMVPAGTFAEHWQQYAGEIVPKTPYPTGFTIKGNVEEVSDEFDVANSGIRIGRSIHGENTIAYHVFINIHYSLK